MPGWAQMGWPSFNLTRTQFNAGVWHFEFAGLYMRSEMDDIAYIRGL